MSAETVPKGYKRTEVGVIPEDWEVKPLREVGTFEKGRGVLKEDVTEIGAMPAIPYTALYTDFGELLDSAKVDNFIDETAKSVVVSEPCVLIASSSNMTINTGKATAKTDASPVAIGREVIIFKTSSSPAYISYQLATNPYRNRTLSISRGTTIKHLYPASFLPYLFALPPITEQKAIAAALSDADALIESLEQLLAKMRQIKQGAMQELLTGKRRLPGFTGKWEKTLLGDICTLKSGESITSKDIYPSGDYLCYGGNGVRGYAKSFTHDGCFLLIGRVGALCGNINLVEGKFYASEHALVGTVCETISHSWLSLILSRLNLNRLSEASAQPVLTSTKLAMLEVILPSLPEQTAIASVLSDMDADLETLEAKLDKARQVKQGMMQQLLTGKVRLV